MKSFSKKSVALIIFVTVLSGFFSVIEVAKAESPSQTQAKIDLIGLNSTKQDLETKLSNTEDPKQKNSLLEVIKNVQAQIDRTNDIISGKIDTTETSLGLNTWNALKSATGQIVDFTAGVAALPGFIGTMKVLQLIFYCMGIFLAVAGAIFDVAMHFAIFDMGSLFNTGSALNYMWTLFRDVINISFIFVLLYIAITMIIGSWGLKAKATLGGVIISAILINFSMFFTKVLIDGGNLIAVALYNQFYYGSFSFTGLILVKLNFLDMLFSVKNFTISGQINTIVTVLLQIVLVTVAAWTFFYGAALFIARSIALMFLIVTSPVAYFVGGTGSWLKTQTSEWWEMFVGQVMVAPVFLFVLLLITKLLQVPGLDKSIDQALDSYSGSINVQGYFYYMIVIGLLLAGTKIAKKMSGKVGKIAINVARVAAGAAALAVTGVAAGAAVGFGAFGTGAAGAASAAGGSATSRLGARLAFSAKDVGARALKLRETTAGKFVTGELGEQPGPVGFAARRAREVLFKGMKGATDSGISPDAIEKYIKKEQKAEVERVKSQAEKGVKAETDKAKQAKNTIDAIESQAEERTRGGEAHEEYKAAIKQQETSEKILNTLTEEHKAATKERDNNKKRVEAIKKESQSTSLDGQGKPIPNPELKNAESALASSEAKVTEVLDRLKKQESAAKSSKERVKDVKKELEDTQEIIAKDMGIAESELKNAAGELINEKGEKLKPGEKALVSSMATLTNARETAKSKGRIALQDRNKLITDLRNQSRKGVMGSLGGLFSFASYGKTSEKLADEIAATQPGRFTASKEKELKKAYKTIAEAYKEEGEGGTEEPKKEEAQPKKGPESGSEGEEKQ